jgi:predicted kinase
LGAGPGAIVLRTDEIRKRLWGRAPTDRLPSEAYSPAAGAAVYAALEATARTVLEAGWSVIADAVFLRPEERARIAAAAEAAGAEFGGLWLQAPPDVLRDRIAARAGDASDADARVLDLQLAADPGPIDWLPVDWQSPTAMDLAGVWRRLGLSSRRTRAGFGV